MHIFAKILDNIYFINYVFIIIKMEGNMDKLKKAVQIIVIAFIILILPLSFNAMAKRDKGGKGGKGGSVSVPEPSAMLLLASTGGGLFILRRYLKKR